jgi:hypothetical protein
MHSRFIRIETGLNPKGNVLHCLGNPQAVRRIVNRVAAENDQGIKLFVAQVFGERAHRRGMIFGDRVQRLMIGEGRPELGIQPMTKRMHFGRLRRAGQNHAAAPGLAQRNRDVMGMRRVCR